MREFEHQVNRLIETWWSDLTPKMRKMVNRLQTIYSMSGVSSEPGEGGYEEMVLMTAGGIPWSAAAGSYDVPAVMLTRDDEGTYMMSGSLHDPEEMLGRTQGWEFMIN